MKRLAVAILLLLFSSGAYAKDCGWTVVRQEPEIKASFTHCQEDRYGDKRLVTTKSEFQDSTVTTTKVVIDCKRFTYFEDDTWSEKSGKLYETSKSDQREREILLHTTYREVAKRVCGK